MTVTLLVSKHSSSHSSESIRRKTVSLTIHQDSLFEAREMRLNLSKLLGNSLIQIMEGGPEETRTPDLRRVRAPS